MHKYIKNLECLNFMYIKYDFQVNFLYAHVMFMLLIDFFTHSIVCCKASTSVQHVLCQRIYIRIFELLSQESCNSTGTLLPLTFPCAHI